MDFESEEWPSHEFFPLNLKEQRRTVETVVYDDILNSKHYIILTGFTSLSNLVDFFGKQDIENLKEVKILIGFEPNIRGRKKYVKLHLDKEIKDYWLKEGFSIILGGAIINLIEKIYSKKVAFKFIDKLHAKIYVGDNFAILGSSNFSKNGLNLQQEANIRVRNNKDIAIEKRQYDDIATIASNYYSKATDYNEKIIELLNNLIQKVTWEEALARAIAEIIEGSWLAEYEEITKKLENAKLWPTQWKGLAQAVTILQNQSNVLIADPTGAGKTKLCTSVILALKHWLIEIGQHENNSLIICPPLVQSKWEEEFLSLSVLNSSNISMGLLSNAGIKSKKSIQDKFKIANILTIDEAHNYLSPDSNRTIQIKNNQANFKILVTATPISKKAEDLLRLIELLDIDNLSDKDFIAYKELIRRPYIKNDATLNNLRNFISQFTIRRTKKLLNKEIDKEPEKYINKLGRTCKFPKQIAITYKTKETQRDKKIVDEINELCGRLNGITYLTSFGKPKYDDFTDEDLIKYISRRVTSAKALCVYMIRSALRSSTAALVEHIEGTDAALRHFGFEGKQNKTGNLIDKIRERIVNETFPRKHRSFKNEMFPSWLVDTDEYFAQCENEVLVYNKISILAKSLSNSRELGKVQTLIKISSTHDNILAFDSTVITLHYLSFLFKAHYPDYQILVASGGEKDKDSKKVLTVFNLESTSSEKHIALCSDKMSESIDLQKASCVMLLDMPSVLRLVEQRVGRVDRMDSIHKEINVYWPNDSEQFSLKADRRIIDTNIMVENIYGSNINVPNDLRDKHFEQTDDVNSIIKEYADFNDKDESWTGIHDSFLPIAELKEGKTALLKEDDYNQFKDVSSSVKTKVSFVNSDVNWCFIATRGSKYKSPKWYFINDEDDIKTDYPEICDLLRSNLSRTSQELKWDDTSLAKYIEILKQKERELLPHKKRRALKVAEAVLRKWKKDKSISRGLSNSITDMLKLLNPKTSESVDYERLAEEWVLILQPYLDKKRSESRSKKYIYNLSSLESDYKKITFTEKQLIEIIEHNPILDSIDSKIASCIIGVAN